MKSIISTLKSQKSYALISGIILFAAGLLGFAFRSSSSPSPLYLVAFIALGFWGILVSFGQSS